MNDGRKDNKLRQIDLGQITSSMAGCLVELYLNELGRTDEITPGVGANKLVKYWPPALTEWPTKGVRDAFYSSPQLPRLLNADASLRPTKPPRGVILSTGEDVPRGQSLRARILVIEIESGEVDREQLTLCQQHAAAGVYASAMAGFLQWLTPRYEKITERLHAEMAELRQQLLGARPHARTPEILANLALGIRYLLNFAQDAGAVGDLEAAGLWQRAWQALQEAATAQARHQEAVAPESRFLRLLQAALASGVPIWLVQVEENRKTRRNAGVGGKRKSGLEDIPERFGNPRASALDEVSA